MSIPAWTNSGLLPPIRPGVVGSSPDRSPYEATIADIVLRFATSVNRCQILDGLLRYRRALHDLGLNRGFQWLNGSFMEEIEVFQNRPPNDIDVVTFFYLPKVFSSQDELIAAATWLGTDEMARFKVDAYYFELGSPMTRSEIQQVSYWYSMWSHRRDQVWKGYLLIDLDPKFDVAAKMNLDATAAEGGVA